jgi:anti-sigma B factor antagonist
MRITQRTVGSITILDLAGGMTRDDGYGEIRATVSPLLKQDHTLFLLDLAEPPYMDSTYVGELVRAFIAVLNHKGALKLVNFTRRMRTLFEIAQLGHVFELFNNEAEALQSF